jgi:hypothetical protein
MWIFVSNLACTTTEQELRICFEAYGTVEIVWITTDKNTGRPMGCVKMPNGSEAQAGIAGLHGTSLGGQQLTVTRSIPDPPPPDDHADAAADAKAPLSSVWFCPNPSGRGRLRSDPTIASEVDISFDPPDVPHPIRDELGIPLDRYLFFVVLTDPLGWDGYTYELVGTDPPPETSGTMPTFRFPNMVMPGIPFLVAYQRRITHRETPVYLEACWHPETGETNRLVWPPHIPLKTAHTYGATALKLLRKVGGRGRPPGPRGFRDEEEFLETLTDIIRAVDSNGMHPTQPRIATFLRAEIEKRLRDAGSATNAEDPINSTVRLIKNHIPCHWKEFVKNALASHKK